MEIVETLIVYSVRFQLYTKIDLVNSICLTWLPERWLSCRLVNYTENVCVTGVHSCCDDDEYKTGDLF
jgi:hypothetical protein